MIKYRPLDKKKKIGHCKYQAWREFKSKFNRHIYIGLHGELDQSFKANGYWTHGLGLRPIELQG